MCRVDVSNVKSLSVSSQPELDVERTVSDFLVSWRARRCPTESSTPFRTRVVNIRKHEIKVVVAHGSTHIVDRRIKLPRGSYVQMDPFGFLESMHELLKYESPLR